MSTQEEEKMQKNNEKINESTRKKGPWLTDEEVEREIERLSQSEAVALARRAAALKYKRRQRLYTLRDLEKKIALPLWQSSFIISLSLKDAIGSSPTNGSSNTKSFGE